MPTYTSQPDDTTGYDAYIEDISPTSNFNNSSFIVGERASFTEKQRGLIKFDLSSIPAGAIIVSATLSLFITADRSNNARTYKAFRLLRNWGETTVTWNKYDGTNNWGTAGATNATDIDTTEMASCSYTSSESAGTEKQYLFTVSEFQKFITGAYTNYGWLIKADTETDDSYEHGSSSHATSGYRPKLVVEYNLPAGEPVSVTPYIMV